MSLIIFSTGALKSNHSRWLDILLCKIPFRRAASSKCKHSIHISVEVLFRLLLLSPKFKALRGFEMFVLAEASGTFEKLLDPSEDSDTAPRKLAWSCCGIGDSKSSSAAIVACAPLIGVEEFILLFFLFPSTVSFSSSSRASSCGPRRKSSRRTRRCGACGVSVCGSCP